MVEEGENFLLVRSINGVNKKLVENPTYK